MRIHTPYIVTRFVLRYRAWFNAVFQAALVFGSLVLSWLLRFDFHLPYPQLLFLSAPILILTRLAAIAYFGLLHGWWRYVGMRDAVGVVKAVSTGSVLFCVFLRFGLQVTSFPRSVYFIEAMLTTCLLAGVRLVSRALAEAARESLESSKRVALIGAGFAGQMILREITRPGSDYYAIGCFDDDPTKRGIKVQGVPVLGTVDELPAILSARPVDEVLIAVPSATSEQMCRFVEICERTAVKFKTVPTLKDVIAGQVSLSQLREVNLDDLLGREPARIDLDSIREKIEGHVVLVTGAAGSIGSELCRQICDYGPSQLICLDQSETGIFYLRRELSKHHNGAQLVYCVADVHDTERMRRLFAEQRPHLVFHAAAYKHVPIMELNVHEAVENNVFAFIGLLSVAEEASCESFVLISSDKAVNPTSVMGATKRICELVLASRPANGMRCVAVRFGNVLGSSGSVVPVLREQLQKQQPLTITHPDVCRFFMTTHEAVALVLQAFAIGSHGDILVLDMGNPVRILDLARSLIRLSGKSENQVSIQFTGLREGEKLAEELFYVSEEILPTSCEKIKRTRATLYNWVELQHHLEGLRACLALNGAGPIRAKIGEIVPEYSYLSRQRQTEEPIVSPAPEILEQSAGRD